MERVSEFIDLKRQFRDLRDKELGYGELENMETLASLGEWGLGDEHRLERASRASPSRPAGGGGGRKDERDERAGEASRRGRPPRVFRAAGVARQGAIVGAPFPAR